MMHHPNMHHQPMSGHPPQHMPTHQGMPAHHQMPPHQMHRENRVPLGPSQAGGGMGAHGVSHGHGQAIGNMGGMPVPPHHAPQRGPHPIRAMPHHPPTQHHSMPPHQGAMKAVRRGYMGGGYGGGGGGGVVPPPYAPPPPPPEPRAGGADHQPQPHPPATHAHTTQPPPANIPGVSSPSVGVTGGGSGGGGGDDADMATGDNEATRPPPPPPTTANSKEKTPMCLVNELARYNKIKHQYRLTSETGPAHKKVFTVTLRLGDTEEYTAEGSSIKRAQHAAASAALTATAFPPPPPRAPPAHHHQHHHHRHNGAVMPTVELNALAMKLCQPAIYTSIPPVAGAGPAVRAIRPPRLPPSYRLPPFVPNAYQRVVGPSLIYRVRVCVGGRAWLGEGGTPQAARHDAAARALHDLRPPPPPPATATVTHGGNNVTATTASGSDNANEHDAANAANNDVNDAGDGGDLLNSEVKSPVSLVHELALKRNLSVLFSVKSERGPPHMRVFITVCTVGDMETEGEGNGKKVSKRRAAERMLDEMRRRWPPALLRARTPHDKRKPLPAKKKPRNLIKEGGTVSTSNSGGCDNPISRLAVARHAARARSPQYRVLEERGAARKREFLVQCDAPPHKATGLGPNKKTAKRRAAHNVLIAMEMATANEGAPQSNNASDCSGASSTDGQTITANGDVKRKQECVGNAGDVRQPVPGVLMMDFHQRTGQPPPPAVNGVSESSALGGSSPGGAKDQLMYLSQLLGFTVQFSDFPKRNHGSYLSLVSLSTEPPVMCHGGGPSTQHSHEQCARAALRALKLMGLDANTNASANANANAKQLQPASTAALPE